MGRAEKRFAKTPNLSAGLWIISIAMESGDAMEPERAEGFVCFGPMPAVASRSALVAECGLLLVHDIASELYHTVRDLAQPVAAGQGCRCPSCENVLRRSRVPRSFFVSCFFWFYLWLLFLSPQGRGRAGA